MTVFCALLCSSSSVLPQNMPSQSATQSDRLFKSTTDIALFSSIIIIFTLFLPTHYRDPGPTSSYQPQLVELRESHQKQKMEGKVIMI